MIILLAFFRSLSPMLAGVRSGLSLAFFFLLSRSRSTTPPTHSIKVARFQQFMIARAFLVVVDAADDLTGDRR
jgi:hypothetical protein